MLISLTYDRTPLPELFDALFCSSLAKSDDLATSDRFLCCSRHATDSKSPHTHFSNSSWTALTESTEQQPQCLDYQNQRGSLWRMSLSSNILIGANYPFPKILSLINNNAQQNGFRMHLTDQNIPLGSEIIRKKKKSNSSQISCMLNPSHK